MFVKFWVLPLALLPEMLKCWTASFDMYYVSDFTPYHSLGNFHISNLIWLTVYSFFSTICFWFIPQPDIEMLLVLWNVFIVDVVWLYIFQTSGIMMEKNRWTQSKRDPVHMKLFLLEKGNKLKWRGKREEVI